MSGWPITNGVETFIAAPDGYVVDFDNPQQNKALEHYIIFGIGAPLAFVALMQRYYTKIWLSKGLQVDDGFIFLGWLTSMTTQALLVHSVVKHGMCTHAFEMPLTRFEEYSLMTYVAAPMFMMCNGFTKLSLLSFYLHLSPQKWFRIATWGMIGVVALYTTIITFLMFFQCNPIRRSFDFSVQDFKCIDAGILYIATAVTNIVTDIILFILPIRMILGLHMGVAQKIGAMVVFGVGSMTVATSVVRLVYLPPIFKSMDPSWDAAPANVWTLVEANLFVICASMPTLRKFFKHVAPTIMGSSYGSNSYGRSYGPSYGRSSNAPRSGTTQSRTRKQRKMYEKFGIDHEMQPYPATTKSDGTVQEPVITTTNVDANSTENVGDTDNHSEKAILQTKSFTITYDRNV